MNLSVLSWPANVINRISPLALIPEIKLRLNRAPVLSTKGFFPLVPRRFQYENLIVQLLHRRN